MFHGSTRFLNGTTLCATLFVLPFVRVSIVRGDPCPEFLPGTATGLAEPADLTESSGLAASRKNPGIIWTHNDNWNDQRLFALRADGLLHAIWTVSASPPVSDPEDVAIGPGPIAGEDYIYFGDIGDNNNVRSNIRVFRAREPVVPVDAPSSGGTLASETITLVYPDGPRDAETLMVDTNGDLYLVAKRVTPGRVYRAPYPQSTTGANTLQIVGQLPGWGSTQVTGGDIAVDGTSIIIRGYSRITIWERFAGESIATALSRTGCNEPTVWEPQGEAVCFGPLGREYFTLSEGVVQPLYRFGKQIECQFADECDDGDPCTEDFCTGLACVNLPLTSDEDFDLVPDCADECPGTPIGIPVDAFGCELNGGGINIYSLVSALTAWEPDPIDVARFDRNGDLRLNGLDLPFLLIEILGG